MLWEEHINWTRSAIVSIVFYTPDQDLVIKRLLRNPTDMGNVLQPFYGSEKASEFSNLLREHLVIAAQLVKATKAGNTTAAADAEKRWYANADQIAVFLASINPNWSRSEWIAMLHEHLALTKSEAVSMITKDYGAAVSILDTIERQALTMADVMAEGIIRQFPDKFPC
jgi:hypothetical protein